MIFKLCGRLCFMLVSDFSVSKLRNQKLLVISLSEYSGMILIISGEKNGFRTDRKKIHLLKKFINQVCCAWQFKIYCYLYKACVTFSILHGRKAKSEGIIRGALFCTCQITHKYFCKSFVTLPKRRLRNDRVKSLAKSYSTGTFSAESRSSLESLPCTFCLQNSL